MALIVYFTFDRGTTYQKNDPEQGLSFLAQHCPWAVVMLGSKGCIACHGNEVWNAPLKTSEGFFFSLCGKYCSWKCVSV
jgi:hypothetical protein